MAKEYQARADSLLKEQQRDDADGALSFPAPNVPSSTVQQQQPPQEAPGSANTQFSPFTPRRS
jgi:hypothetical protein